MGKKNFFNDFLQFFLLNRQDINKLEVFVE